MKTPVIDDVDDFISSLADELEAFNRSPFVTDKGRTPLPMEHILPAVRELIGQKRMQPNHQVVQDRAELLCKYAILSHRWKEEELSFTDVAKLSDPTVQAKKGFQKLKNFSKAIEQHYGCRYLWMDTACIDEVDRDRSIPRMFSWYRHAYVCAIYLASHPTNGSMDAWFTRGWTLQEFLAACRIRVFMGNTWTPASREFDTRRDSLIFNTSPIIKHIANSLNWLAYEPGIESTIPLFHAMCQRETTRSEDRVYCLLSALDINISIEYGEGFDRAFGRLQAYYLTHQRSRDLLLWDVAFATEQSNSCSSPWSSMLVSDFETFRNCYIGRQEGCISNLPNSSIAFDEAGLMHIMVTLFPQKALHRAQTHMSNVGPPHGLNVVFASLHVAGSGNALGFHPRNSYYYGVWLRPVPSTYDTAMNHSSNVSGEEGGPKGNGRVVYERVSLQRVKTSDLPQHDLQEPEWVYIR
ncbi:hypothetical protein PLEOSDRAFT_1103943 [Pleurotus ostreatus PC15]|uniref:Heterokaryon incompatibility domain-containing protein n=1 Tax=Pleurotus ostreatus (strain PC15) TaxID=1137138 RepID=A0A067NGS9_PLEO1|nr:hypothetical protein PLEOSDRAFT_1103943 [Pleurotus ostreatus PC15]